MTGTNKIMQNKSILIVAHKFLTQPDDELVVYLTNKSYPNVMHIMHSFSDAPDRKSYYKWYKDGKLYKNEETADYKNWIEPLIYLKELFFTLKWVFSSGLKWQIFIGMDGLCVLFGNLLKTLNKVNKTVYWAVDFVPQNRFDKGWKDKVYHLINTSGYKNSDEMWDFSPRMMDAREKFLGLKPTDYKRHKIVPYAVWLDRIKKYSYEDCDKNTLVFMGHLLEKQGAQLIIKAIPEIVKKMPDFKFKVIGTGKYKEALILLAKELNVWEYCNFMGKVDDHKDLENEIAKSCLAIAPYIKELDTWTYYADPGKVKTYLACGVPVLLTDVPWNASEIEQKKCGKIITEDIENIVSNVLLFMNSNENQLYRDNAIKYAESFNYPTVFDGLNL